MCIDNNKINLILKTMNKLKIFCILAILLQSCQPTYYTSLPKLLNKCQGYAVVVGTAHNNENYRKSEHHTIVVMDSTNKSFQFKGGDYGYADGDTLIVKK